MSRLILALTILAVALVACPPAAMAPSPTPIPSQPPATASPSPVASPAESPAPTAPSPTPRPSAEPSATPAPVVTPRPTAEPITFTKAERHLVDGIQRNALDCRPVRQELPPKAYAGVECRSDDPAVARMGFYLFHTDEDMLDAYYARVRGEGLRIGSGACADGREGESAFIPGEPDDVLVDRHACFLNDQGFANYRVTMSGGLYVGLLGRSTNMVALEDFAWRGSVDVPGFPTIWSEGAS
jgi:hypothetical protein